MDEKLYIPVILGTNRKGSQSENVAKLLVQEIQKNSETETILIDVERYQFPKDDYGESLIDSFPDYHDAIVRADGLVIVSPEYNHGYPGALKSLLDTMLEEYVHKAVGLVGVSSGPWGGTRVIQALIPVVRELGLAVTFTDLNFPRVKETFDENGNLKDEAYYDRVEAFLNELIWMSKVLRWGRQNISSKFHSI